QDEQLVLERDLPLIKGDQHLPAEGRERVAVEPEGHGGTSRFFGGASQSGHWALPLRRLASGPRTRSIGCASPPGTLIRSMHGWRPSCAGSRGAPPTARACRRSR